MPYLPPVVANMVRFQQASGCRPGEVCAVRPCDVDTLGSAWIYTPRRHKTDYRGHTRVIFVGPKGQDALRRYLLRPAKAFCFCPAEGERKRRADLHQKRVTPLSWGNRPGSNRRRRPKKHPGDRYTSRSYHAAVRHAVIKANEDRKKKGIEERVPAWHPNQLRHSAATAIRKHFGLEAVQAVQAGAAWGEAFDSRYGRIHTGRGMRGLVRHSQPVGRCPSAASTLKHGMDS